MPEIQRPPLGDRFGPSRIFSAAELMAEELPPVRWVVPGLLPEGVTLLAGKPKLGKSWLALGLGMAVASGGVALGTKQVECGDVLYLALEDNPRRLQGRLGKMLAGGEAPKGLYYATEWPRSLRVRCRYPGRSPHPQASRRKTRWMRYQALRGSQAAQMAS